MPQPTWMKNLFPSCLNTKCHQVIFLRDPLTLLRLGEVTDWRKEGRGTEIKTI